MKRQLLPRLTGWLAAGLVLLASGCAPEESAPQVPVAYASFGTEITPADAMPVEQIVEDAERLGGQIVKVTGTVREVCQNKGCWMTLEAGGEKSVRVTFRDYGFFVPKDIAGRTVVLEGTVRMEELSVETLRHYAEESGKSEEEIAAIDAPDVQLTVIADGVLVEEVAQPS